MSPDDAIAATGARNPRIEEGEARVWFAFDLGQQIDLDGAQKRFAAGTERELIRHERRAPAYLQFHPAPLRLDESGKPLAVGACSTDGSVESTIYDFGAVSIAYRIALGGRGLDELHALANALEESKALLADATRRAQALIDKLGPALRAASLSDVVEDYVVYHVRRWSPVCDPRQVVDANRERVARILRCEPGALRGSEVDDALQSRISYGMQDELVIDWNGALLFEALGEDTLAVLEFANVELLEMRFLDDRLDQALERSHEVVRARSGKRRSRMGRRETRDNMRRIAFLQIENAILFESVNNAIKLLGDQFLARVYRLAARRFHLDDWDGLILRKLQTLASIHQELSDEHSTRRMEALEWIIIALFLISIVIPFVVGGGH